MIIDNNGLLRIVYGPFPRTMENYGQLTIAILMVSNGQEWFMNQELTMVNSLG